jgi:hypothetical protein
MTKSNALSSLTPGSAMAARLGASAGTVKATSRLEGIGALLLVLAPLVVATGCEDEPTALLLDVRARTMISTLSVQVKRYEDDEAHTVYVYPATNDIEVGSDLDGYVVSVNGEPLRLNIELPGDGRYAVHLVGVPLDDPATTRLISTTCYDVTELAHDTSVVLGRLTQGPTSLDVDRDTFPEDNAAFCAYNPEIPCNISCTSPDFFAAQDCNPDADWQDPECGGERGEDVEWNPFAVDLCGDCLDRDCYAGDARCEDRDGDGYPSDVDCDDRNAAINPGAEEVCGNGIDENCYDDVPECTDGDRPCDNDNDGYLAQNTAFEGCGRDCDDDDPDVNPSAYEGYGSDTANPESNPGCGDGIDNNCDGRIDERCSADLDDDGVELSNDCNDCNAAFGPGFPEPCGDNIDQDCTGADTVCSASDLDRDGYDAEYDCNDSDNHIFNGAPEYCGDGILQGCSLDASCDADSDGDHYNAGETVDCDDGNANIHPWATEVCDAAGDDDDCDGQVNEVLPDNWSTTGCIFDIDGATDIWREIYFASDMEHCGRCRHACQNLPTYNEGNECIDGACRCYGAEGCPGTVDAFCCEVGGCVNITMDLAHCGDCETACVSGEVCEPQADLNNRGHCFCRAGSVVTTCDPSTDNACCDGIGCTDVNADVHNCGLCGNDCTVPGDHARGDICALSAGSTPTCFCGDIGVVCTEPMWCTEVNPPGGVSCGCANLNGDRFNCGECYNACDENPGGYEDCVDGQCGCSSAGQDCAGGMTAGCCSGVDHCVNLLTDTSNCGSCRTHCTPGEVCVDGECRCNGGAGCVYESQVCCSRGCTNVLSDESNCGPVDSLDGCGRTCRPGVECEDGNCSCGAGGDCGGSETCCNNSLCVNLDTSFANCGRCDFSCDVGEQCSGGNCACTPACSDGDSCTEDSCDVDNCVHHTLDGDDDGYCASWCSDSGRGDCIEGDCDDANPSANAGRTELCTTSFDDDCDGSNNDIGATGCTTYYLDHDDDTYGVTTDTQCRCAPTGEYTATRGGDCADSNAARNPAATEQCNGIDDDCNASTADGDAQCAGFCCGSPAACHTCCSAGQCTATHDSCSGYACLCDTGWSDCSSDCDCNTGGAACCSGTSCIDTSGSGTGSGCCNSSHCGSGTWTCSGNSCSCAVEVCTGDFCRTSGQCCDTGDCGTGSWTCTAAHACSCSRAACGDGYCPSSGQCCSDADCPSSNDHCDTGSHTCVCNTGWEGCGGTCNCNTASTYCCESGTTCINTSGDGCCTDTDCPDANTYCNDGTDQCDCDSGWSDCEGSCDCHTGTTECCDTGSCLTIGSGAEGAACCDDTHCDGSSNCSATNTCACDSGYVTCGSTTCGCRCCESSTCINPTGTDLGTGAPCCNDSECHNGDCRGNHTCN